MPNRIVFTLSLMFVAALSQPWVCHSAQAAPEDGKQSDACATSCRQNYVSKIKELQACLRACSTGREGQDQAQAGGRSGWDPGAVEATSVKSSKSNSQDRVASPAASESATVKSSKSNSSERGSASPAVPAEASNLNLSKSNVDRAQENPADETPPYRDPDSDEDG